MQEDACEGWRRSYACCCLALICAAVLQVWISVFRKLAAKQKLSPLITGHQLQLASWWPSEERLRLPRQEDAARNLGLPATHTHTHTHCFRLLIQWPWSAGKARFIEDHSRHMCSCGSQCSRSKTTHTLCFAYNTGWELWEGWLLCYLLPDK